MKKFAITVMNITLTFSSFGQDKLFLTVKSDPLVYSKPDYLKGFSTKTISTSVSMDSKYLSFALTETKMETNDIKNMKMTFNPISILIDMELGEIVSKIRNTSLFFDGNQLMKCAYKDLWDNPFYITDINSKLYEATEYFNINPSNLEVISKIDGPKGEFYSGTDRGYVKMIKMAYPHTTDPYTALYKLSEGKLSLIGKYNLSNGSVSGNGQFISGTKPTEKGKTSIVVYDISTGNLVKEINLKKDETPISTLIDAKKQIIVYYLGSYNLASESMPHGLKILDLESSKTIKDFPNDGGVFILNDKGDQVMITLKNGRIKFLDMNSYQFVGEDIAFIVNEKDLIGAIPIPLKIGDGKFIIIGNSTGISKLVNTETKKVVADIYVDETDWAIVAADGRVDGTPGAFNKLEWRKYDKKAKVIDQIPLDMVFERNYTPKLLSLILKDGIINAENFFDLLANIPNIKIESPATNSKQSKKDVEITVTATPNGDPIREIQLFVNNKLIGSDERGFKTTGQTKTFVVSLAQGTNKIAAKAISNKGFESSLHQIELNYEGEQATANLYIFAIGLNTYQNATYNLNYAIADANAVVNKLKSNTTGIFKNTFVYTLYDLEANRDGIIAKMSEISKVSQPEDVFIFYYAGHGVMEEISNEFYLALFDVTQLYGKPEILKSKGISSNELKNYFSNIKAQKQLIILDACQSGGAVNTFAMRGAAEEKALVQLARSSGVVLLASTGSEQFATEFKELGHGVFTYALLEGLNGKADGGQKDNKITVKELEAYINDNIPTLTDRYKGQAQYPRSWSMGQDFPIVIAK